MASGPDAINNAPRRRSASLCLNLIATWLDVNEATLPPPAPGSLAREVELAVQVENAYVGSPCGNLDQIMIWCRRRVRRGAFECGRVDGVQAQRVVDGAAGCRGRALSVASRASRQRR